MSNTDDFKKLIDRVEEEPKEVQEVSAEVPEVITEVMDSTLTALAPTAIEKSIIEQTLQGFPIPTISFSLGVPESHIRTFIRKPKVREYLKDLKEAMNEVDQLMLSSTLRKMVQGRVEELEDGESYASLSKKDTLDIIKTFADITNQVSKNQKEDKETSVFATIYQQILN